MTDFQAMAQRVAQRTIDFFAHGDRDWVSIKAESNGGAVMLTVRMVPEHRFFMLDAFMDAVMRDENAVAFHADFQMATIRAVIGEPLSDAA